jgi:hypothetical protein
MLDVLLEITHRGSSRDGWRVANFSIRNRTDKELLVKEIALGFDSSGISIAPAIAEEADVWRMDREQIGHTILLNQILSISNDKCPRQSAYFYVRHPRDVVDFGRHRVEVSILIENMTAPKKQWWTTIEALIPQESGDPVTFSERGPLDCWEKERNWA